MMAAPYEQEIAVFGRNLQDWLKEHAGQWVVIRGGQVVDFYSSAREGYLDAMDRFGESPFLLREVTEKRRVISVPMVQIKGV